MMLINVILAIWAISCLAGLYVVCLSLQGLVCNTKVYTKNGLYYWDDKLQAWRKINKNGGL